jgi:hypothetical protein
MSSQVANAVGFDLSALFKSAGTSCTTPLEIFLCDMHLLWLGFAEASAQECSPPGAKCPQCTRLNTASEPPELGEPRLTVDFAGLWCL